MWAGHGSGCFVPLRDGTTGMAPISRMPSGTPSHHTLCRPMSRREPLANVSAIKGRARVRAPGLAPTPSHEPASRTADPDDLAGKSTPGNGREHAYPARHDA